MNHDIRYSDRRRQGRHAPITNYAYPFIQWLGTTPGRSQRQLIEQIERHRRQNPSASLRIFVDDDGSRGDTVRRILVLYLTWLNERATPHFDSLLAARTKKTARLMLPDRRQYGLTRPMLLGSARTPHSIRGHTFHNALLLDCDRYGRAIRCVVQERSRYTGNYIPHRLRAPAYGLLAQTVLGVLPTGTASLLIVHGNPASHPRRLYARHRRELLQTDTAGLPVSYISICAQPPPDDNAGILSSPSQSPPPEQLRTECKLRRKGMVIFLPPLADRARVRRRKPSGTILV